MNRMIAMQAETVIVADDHPLFRTAIKEALEAEQGETNFLEASSFESLQALVDEQKEVDLVLLDLHMPGVSGFAGLVYLCKRYPSVPVVIISANEDPVVIKRALELGASALILVHNHPSGDAAPSKADIEMTREVQDAADKLGIAVHDHIVIGKSGHSSFKAMELL